MARIFTKIKDALLRRKPVAHSYKHGTPNYLGVFNLDNLPPFTLFTADTMLKDPQVKFGLTIRNGGLLQAEVEVKGDSEQEVAFVKRQWDRLWNMHAGLLLRAKRWGYAPFEVTFRQETGRFKGWVGVDDLHFFHPRDARLLIREGQHAGIRVSRLRDVGQEQILMPSALWVTHQADTGNRYGMSINYDAYSPWWEKWMERGAKDVLRLRMIRDAYSGDVFKVPMELVERPDGTQVPYMDLIREAIEDRLAGSPMFLPNMLDDNGNSLIEYTPPSDNGRPEGILEWAERLDWDIWKGQGVVREVVEAATSGSGYSGRSIPMTTFLTALGEELKEVVRCVDRDVLRHLVHINMGREPSYEIHPKSLVETFADDMSNSGMGGPMGGIASQGQSPQWGQQQLQGPPQPHRQFADFDPAKHPRDEEGKFTIPQGKTHSIGLPKNKKRMTIDQAGAALAEMGYELGKGDYDLQTQETKYLVTGGGEKRWVNAKELREMVYGASSVQFAEDEDDGPDATTATHDRLINTAQSAITRLLRDTKSDIAKAVKKNDLTDWSFAAELERLILFLSTRVGRALVESRSAAGIVGMATVADTLLRSEGRPIDRSSPAIDPPLESPEPSTTTVSVSPATDYTPASDPEADAPILPPPIDTPNDPPPDIPSGPDGIFPDDGEPEIHFPELDSAVNRLRRADLFTSDDYLEVAREAQQGAFAVTGELREETLNDMRLILARNLQEGADAEAFVRDVNELLDEGTGLSEARLHQVFRNNMQTTISDSMERTLAKPLVVDFFQYRAYFSTSDERRRDTHKALETLGLNGTNIYNKDDPVWKEFRPIWDYGCRCSWAPVTVRDAAKRGVVEAQEWWARAEAMAAEEGGRPAIHLAATAPTSFQFVPHPPFHAPPGFSRR